MKRELGNSAVKIEILRKKGINKFTLKMLRKIVDYQTVLKLRKKTVDGKGSNKTVKRKIRLHNTQEKEKNFIF
jgi:hypothetical protein